MSDIVLFGATGFTGQRVAEQLHAQGLPFAVAGRNPQSLQRLSERLGGVPVRVADAEQPRTLNRLTDGARVLINCAGPFLRYGEPVVNAAVEAGTHYVDTTGEQTWMKRILNRYDHIAARSGVTVLNALAFEYAIGDWLAAHAAQGLGRGQPLDAISIGYSLTGSGITPGTLLSIFEMMGERGWSYEASRWQRRPAGWASRTLRFPFGERTVTWLPFGEVLMVPRHERVQTVLTYSRLPTLAGRLLPTLAPLGPVARGALRPLAERLVARRPAGPTPEQRQRTRFALVAEAQRGDQRCLATGTGGDPYGITATIAVLGAELLLAGDVPPGVRAPAHLPLAPEEALRRIGVTLTTESA